MGDPVSSVAYAIEAALRALHGDLALLIPTMLMVVGLVALIVFNYHALVGRFPEGGGAAAAAGSAFGEAWASRFLFEQSLQSQRRGQWKPDHEMI